MEEGNQPTVGNPQATTDQQTPAVTDPQPTVESPLADEPKEKKRFAFLEHKAFIAFLIILALITMGALVYFYIQNQNLKKEMSQPVPAPIPTTFPDTSTPIPDPTADWETYKNEEMGFELKYPGPPFELTEKEDSISIRHSIPYKHMSPCAMVGDEPPLDKVGDFGLTLKIANDSLVDTFAPENSYLRNEGYIENDKLKIEPGFIDEYRAGTLKGYKVTVGAGCGNYEHYFPIDENHTLIATRGWEITTEYGGIPDVLNLPGLITNEQHDQYFNQILSTFEFIDTEPLDPSKLPQPNVCESNNDCPSGYDCVNYYGFGGDLRYSCEIKCSADNDCPEGYLCAVISDGPKDVCSKK